MGYGNWTYAVGPPPIITMVADAVQGISWATAYDFNDVALAIIANPAWGVVDWSEGCGVPARQFCSGVQLQVGNGVVTTYFRDYGFQTIFKTGILTVNYQPLFQVSSTGLAQFGLVINAARKSTYYGCMLMNLETVRRCKLLGVAVGGLINLYSYLHVCGTQRDRSNIMNGDAWNCHFTNSVAALTISIWPVNMDMYNCMLTYGAEGLAIPQNCQLDDIKLFDCGVRFVIAFAANIDLRNSTMRNSPLNLDSRWNTHYFTNCIHDNWANIIWAGVQAGITRRRVEFNLTVRDRVTGGLLNGVANLYDNVGGVVFSVPIVAGVIATQTVNTYWISQAMGVNWQPYGPFHLQILVPGYETYDDYNLPLDNQLAGPIYKNIGLVRIVDLIFVDGRVALNLDEDNPESELYTQI